MSRLGLLLRHDLLRRSLYFSVSVVLATVVGIISIPLISVAVGIEAWGRLFILQVVGQFAAIVIGFGWGATGPSMASALPEPLRRQYLYESLFARVPLFLVVVPLATAVGTTLGVDPWTSLLAAITYGIPGIGAAWFFVGINRPMLLLWFDAVPSIVGQALGLVAVSLVPSLTAYLVTTAVATSIGVIAGILVGLRHRGELPLRVPRWSALRETMKAQVAGLATVLFSGLSIAFPALIVDVFARPLVPAFGIFDRFYRYGIIVLTPVLQAVQGWVPEAGPEHVAARARQTLWAGLGVGIAGGAALAGLSTWVGSLLTGGQVVLPLAVAILAGIGFLAECVAQIVGLAGLVALGRGRVLARSSMIAALIGIPLMIPAVLYAGLVGVVGVIAASALFVAAYRVIELFRATRPRSIAG